ncbi:MAG: VWA domain-containing protein [Polyangiaceae bacterium]
MRPTYTVGTIVFGATAVAEEPPRRRSEPRAGQRASVGRDGTDIDRALRRALAEVPADSGARIVLVSDGVSTRGDPVAGAAAALAAEVPIDVLALEQQHLDDVRVVSLRTVSRGDDGESVDLRVVTSSPKDADVDVTLSVDGVDRAPTRARISAGEDVLRIREKLSGAGLHRYEVRVTPVDPGLDFSPDDNGAAAFVRVRGKASALVLDSSAEKTAFIASSLRAAGFDVTAGGPSYVPFDLGGFAAHDLVVFGDIPARALTTTQIEAFAMYVRDFGGGALFTGGDKSFGPGGYGKTPLEEVSPNSFDIKQDQRRQTLSEIIAIDISGSMGAPVGGSTKLELANEAAARSAELLGPGDRLGVEHVDTQIYWSVPLGPVTDAAAIDKAIRSVRVGGGGIIVPLTLEAGYAALAADPGALKHMLLFADGSDAEEATEALPLTISAFSQSITTSVVALGNGSDVPTLEKMAREGGGRFYLVEDATRLPAVFAEETVLAARSAIHEDPFRPTLGTRGAVTNGVDVDGAPALLGYVVTIPKPRATVHLLGPDGDPLLSSWSIGIGKSALFASDLKDRWGGAWTSWPGAARLLAQLGHELERKGDDERIVLDTDTTGGELRVRANVTDDAGHKDSFRRLTAHVAGPGGFVNDIELEPIGAGEYAGSLPLTRPGTYSVVAADAVTQAPLAFTGASMSLGEELRPTGTDHALLERIASVSRGKVRRTLEGTFLDRENNRFAYDDVTPAFTLAAALLFFFSVAARRLAIPAPRWSKLVAWLPKRSEKRIPEVTEAATLPALFKVKGTRTAPRAAPPPPQDGPAAPPPERVKTVTRGSPPQPVPPPKPAIPAPAAPPPARPPTATPPVPPPPPPPAGKLSTMEMLAAKKRKR